MKAVVWQGDSTLDIETVEDARIEAPTDILTRITSSAIFGTELHIYESTMGDGDGMVVGNEAVVGAGAIGLLTAYCALHLRGAPEVYVVDSIPERLAKAGELGAIPIDFRAGDPVEQILEQRGRTRKNAGATWRGEERMGGVNCGIDAIGFQARDRADPTREKPDQVIHDLARLINPNGRLVIIGVFLPNDAKPVGEIEKPCDPTVPRQMLF